MASVKTSRYWERALSGSLAVCLLGTMAGCGSMITDKNGRVYHCVDTARSAPPPNTRSKTLPLEIFEYGDYRIENRPTIATGGHCATLRLPPTAYLRYRVDGRVIEKHFDLSSLTAWRVHNKTVEFYVNDDKVEVRLLTPVPGKYVDTKEIITQQ